MQNFPDSDVGIARRSGTLLPQNLALTRFRSRGKPRAPTLRRTIALVCGGLSVCASTNNTGRNWAGRRRLEAAFSGPQMRRDRHCAHLRSRSCGVSHRALQPLDRLAHRRSIAFMCPLNWKSRAALAMHVAIRILANAMESMHIMPSTAAQSVLSVIAQRLSPGQSKRNRTNAG